MKYSAFAAFYPDGNMAVWCIRATRKDCAQQAVRGMMGFREYEDLENDKDRWAHCYKRGCRIKRVTVLEQQP